MDVLERATGILKRAQAEVADLLGDAGKQERYDDAARLIEVAREIKELADRLATPAASNGHSPSPAPKPDGESASRRGSGPKRPAPGEYPCFLREGDTLIKIGWSKSNKAEYEHKCPRKVLALLAAAISKAGPHGKRFTMDQILPLKHDGSELPSYQPYLALAWLRILGFVKQHGRKGYSLGSRAPIQPMIETHWNDLPSR